MADISEATLILLQARDGSQRAYNKLFPLVYDRLRNIANRHIKQDWNNDTYSKTDLVHEAYLQLIDIDKIDWQCRAHFYSIASRCMRRILIIHARKKKTERRGGNFEPVTYIDEILAIEQQAGNLINLDDTLNELEELNPRLSEIVECRYFGGMTIKDTAEALNISESTVKRDWIKAKGWLYKELKSKFG